MLAAEARSSLSWHARWLPLLVAVIAALWFNRWVLDPAHFFFADDWGWLERAQFGPWQNSIHLLPTAIYNDRPVGELLIRGLYEVFWLCLLYTSRCV